MKRWFSSASVLSLSLSLFPAVGHAETGTADTARPEAIDEIIVTATKRQERINDVPLAITAVSGDELKSRNVTTTADLVHVVPGFNVQTNLNGGPVYYIRGVGFQDRTPTVAPAVTVYTDEVALPLSDMSRGASLDLERVEVLKGPQGTLFGGNSTGGAINFIAAKPTGAFEAGMEMGFGRFGAANVQGHISGPLSDTVSVRVAGEYRMQGGWQYSATGQPGLRGGKDFLNGRISMSFKPTSNLSFLFTASGWRDRSDSQQSQFVLLAPATPYPPVISAITAASYVPTNARISDWLAGSNQKRDDSFYQFSLRSELDLSAQVKLTSLTSYSYLSLYVPSSLNGINYPVYNIATAKGKIFSQELRLSGDMSSLRWMVGGNYQRSILPNTIIDGPFSVSNAFGAYDSFRMVNDQKVTDYAVFGSLEQKLTDTITARASIRYSQENRDHQGCLADGGDGKLAALFGLTSKGVCVTVDDVNGTFASNPAPTSGSLNQNNVSWRVGLDWKAAPHTLFYAIIAKGFKAGGYSAHPYVLASQMVPATQESLLDYEVGLKTDLFDRKVHLDLSGFYYDYTNKQLLGTVNNPFFGPLPILVNIPSSRVIGGEFSLTVRPTDGLKIQLAGTVLDTKVLKDPSNPVDPLGRPATFVGEPFSDTPKYQLTADIEQSFRISENASGYVGSSLEYHSRTQDQFGTRTYPDSRAVTTLPSYTLINLRAGVKLENPNMRFEIWGNNVTNKYYYTAAFYNVDAFVRFAAMPSTWGVRISTDF